MPKKWRKMRRREEVFSVGIYASIFSDERDKMSADKRRLWERLQRATRALFTQASQIYRDFSRSLFQKLISREGARIAFAIRQVNPRICRIPASSRFSLAFLPRLSTVLINVISSSDGVGGLWSERGDFHLPASFSESLSPITSRETISLHEKPESLLSLGTDFSNRHETTDSSAASLSRSSPMHRYRFHFRTLALLSASFAFISYRFRRLIFRASSSALRTRSRRSRDSRLFIARRMTERIDHELHFANATTNSRIGSFLLFARVSGRARALRRMSAKIAAAD